MLVLQWTAVIQEVRMKSSIEVLWAKRLGLLMMLVGIPLASVCWYRVAELWEAQMINVSLLLFAFIFSFISFVGIVGSFSAYLAGKKLEKETPSS